MNLTKVALCSPAPQAFQTVTHTTISFTSKDRSSPLILKKATGLDAEEIIKTYNDGPEFFRTRPKERKVSFQLKLNPNYAGKVTIGDLRDQLYRLIAFNSHATRWNTDTRLELKFFNDQTYVASLFGYVTRVETDVFSNSSDLIFEVTCDDPFLRSVVPTNLNANIQLNSTASHTYFNGITYNVESAFSCTDTKSTAPHGFTLTATCISPPPDNLNDPPKFIIWDNRNPLYYIFSVTHPFEVGDIVWFSSEEDNRYIYVQMINDGWHTKNLINNIYWGSIWPMVSPGENFLEVSEGFKITSVAHRESYWGI